MAKKKINPRYIDANLAKDALLGWETDPSEMIGNVQSVMFLWIVYHLFVRIDNIPTADVAEVKHGEWIRYA